MAKAAAKTGVSPTALIAIEQYFPKKQRIIEDDLVYRILPFSAKALVWLAIQLGQKLDDPCNREKLSRHLGRYDVQKAVYRRETNRFEKSD